MSFHEYVNQKTSSHEGEVEENVASMVIRMSALVSRPAGGRNGNGHEIAHVLNSVAICRSIAARRGLDPATDSVVVAPDDAMQTYIAKGDEVFLRHADQEWLHGRIYVLGLYGQIVIRRMFYLEGGRYRLSCDHPDKARYPDIEWSAPLGGDLVLYGPVLGRQGAV